MDDRLKNLRMPNQGMLDLAQVMAPTYTYAPPDPRVNGNPVERFAARIGIPNFGAVIARAPMENDPNNLTPAMAPGEQMKPPANANVLRQPTGAQNAAAAAAQGGPTLQEFMAATEGMNPRAAMLAAKAFPQRRQRTYQDEAYGQYLQMVGQGQQEWAKRIDAEKDAAKKAELMRQGGEWQMNALRDALKIPALNQMLRDQSE